MKRIVLCCLFAAAACHGVAVAQDSHREAAVRVLEVSQSEKMVEQVHGMLGAMLDQQMASLDLPSEASADVAEVRAEMTTMLEGLLGWEELSEFLTTVYVDVFSEDELNQLADFYESELGQKLIERQPQLMEKSMAWSQQTVQERLPAFLERLEETLEEIRARHADQGSVEG